MIVGVSADFNFVLTRMLLDSVWKKLNLKSEIEMFEPVARASRCICHYIVELNFDFSYTSNRKSH